MDALTKESAYVPRSNKKHSPKQKPKKRIFWRVFGIIVLILFVGGGSFLYGTDQGLQLRRMFLGTVLSTYHPQYEKYMELLLPKSEIDKLYKERYNPDVVQTKIAKPKKEQKAL